MSGLKSPFKKPVDRPTDRPLRMAWHTLPSLPPDDDRTRAGRFRSDVVPAAAQEIDGTSGRASGLPRRQSPLESGSVQITAADTEHDHAAVAGSSSSRLPGEEKEASERDANC